MTAGVFSSVADRQAEVERRMFSDALARARRATQSAAARGDTFSAPLHSSIFQRELAPLEAEIAAFIAGARERRGVKPALVSLAGHLPPALLAYVGLSVALHLAAAVTPMTNVARAIGAAVEAEARVLAATETAPELVARINRRAAKRGAGPAFKAASLSAAAKDEGVALLRWDVSDRIHIGTVLLDLAMRTTGAMQAELVPRAHKRFQWIISLTPACAEWMRELPAVAAMLRPVYYPMLVEPRVWNGLTGGGYVTNAVRELRLVKRMFPGHGARLATADLRTVYAAVNTLQGTRWRVNAPVMAAMQRSWEADLRIGGLPPREGRELPPRPVNIDTDETVLREWKRQARDVYEANAKDRGARFNVARTLDLAAEFSGVDLYFPHQLDFRGRAYPTPGLLMPQGPDEARGLLTFAQADPVDAEARRWLLIHGANVFGKDKLPFAERAAWAESVRDRAVATTVDPFADLWWADADKPWQFLAWCFDLAAAQETGRSAVPIAMDGSCNGLQHYSAMLRDEVGGAATNLLPADAPQDVYARVAQRTVELLASSDNWMDQRWVALGIINRKLTKRQVMVLPYGGTFQSCWKYTRAAVQELAASDAETAFGNDYNEATMRLSKAIWAAIGDVVVAARAAMVFLQGCARVMAAHQLPLVWNTPSGFPVVQGYKQTHERIIETAFRGSIVRLLVHEDGEKFNGARQALALPPNFVHSYDAATLALTTKAAGEAGITSLAMIHDSYGTTAAHTSQLAAILRDAFVSVYAEHDPLLEFRETCREALPTGVELPPLPRVGALDIQAVRSSPYFFA